MGTGQTLLTIGAIFILGTVILTTNRSLNDTSAVLMHSNIGLEEVSLATSIMEEAEGKAFDQNTDSNAVTSTSQLTPASLLGQENNNPNDLDDFDDYNGLNNQGLRETFQLSTGTYVVLTRVCYVPSNDPSGPASTTQTWNKRMDIWVWNTLTPDTVKMSTVYSYWNF